MTLTVVEDGRVCFDCALIIANGEDGCDPADCGHGYAGAVLSGESDGYEFFVPWRPCPGCGTQLAGSWFDYVILGKGE